MPASFSLTGQDTAKPAYNHMTGFASFGGPLYIPHLMKPSRNPINFFRRLPMDAQPQRQHANPA